jgi:hypothetical protein
VAEKGVASSGHSFTNLGKIAVKETSCQQYLFIIDGTFNVLMKKVFNKPA